MKANPLRYDIARDGCSWNGSGWRHWFKPNGVCEFCGTSTSDGKPSQEIES